MTWLFRILLLVIAFYLIQKLVVFMFGGWSSSTRNQKVKRQSSSGKAIRGQTVKDPQCGMYVASSLAKSLKAGDERLYFCSEDCKEAYLKARELEESSPS